MCVLDEERPVALGQRTDVGEEAIRRPDSFYIQRICCPPGVYVSVYTQIYHSADSIYVHCV